MPVLHTEYGDIDYQDTGSGDTTLFLMPGWCQPKTVFEDFTKLAAVDFRVVSIDWRGHGKSSTNGQDFDGAALLSDALTLIEHLGLTRIVPVAVAHASWISIDLVENLKNRIPAVIFLDWIMNEPEPEFFNSIRDMQNEECWQQARDALYEYWLAESDSPVMIHHLKTEMAESSYQLWRLAGQVIADAYHKYGSPLQRLEKLKNPPQATHIYSLDRSDNYLALQECFSGKYDFFQVRRLEKARTHLAVLERPEDVLEEIMKVL